MGSGAGARAVEEDLGLGDLRRARFTGRVTAGLSRGRACNPSNATSIPLPGIQTPYTRVGTSITNRNPNRHSYSRARLPFVFVSKTRYTTYSIVIRS